MRDLSEEAKKVVIVDITNDRLHRVMRVVRMWQNDAGYTYIHVMEGYPDVEPRTAAGSLD